jgi:hypothetical protein
MTMMATGAEALTRDSALRWATRLYADVVDHKNAKGFAAVFAPDGWLRFGNNPKLVGREAIEAAIARFFSAFLSLRHEPGETSMDGDTLVLEATVTYTRHDGKVVTVPACTIYRLSISREGGMTQPVATECRIYVDLTPLFAPSA